MQHSLLSETRTLFETGHANLRQDYTQYQDSASDLTTSKFSCMDIQLYFIQSIK